MQDVLSNDYKKTVAVELLKYVFGFYFILASAVTAFHMFLEFYNAKQAVGKEMRAVYHAFEPGLTEDVFMVDYEHARQLLKGMAEFPSIAGVILQDDSGHLIHKIGETQGEVGDLVRFNREEGANWLGDSDGLYGEIFPIVYKNESGNFNVGKVTIFSSTQIIFERVKLEFILIIGNASLKTLALWIIFILVSRKLLARPLKIFARLTTELDFEKLREIELPLLAEKQNELTALRDAFNGMIKRLRSYRDQLHRLNRDLEGRVVKRTKDLKALADNLWKREEQIKSILETSDEGFWMLDNDEQILEINAAMCQILGRSRKEMMGKRISQFFDWKNRSILKHQMELRNLGQKGAYEIAVNHATGTQIPCLFNATPIFDSEKKKIGSFAMVTDITERENFMKTLKQRTHELNVSLHQLKNKHNELKQTQTHLVQSEKMAGLGTLVAGVAHEINNPVNFVYLGVRNINDRLTKHQDFLEQLLCEEPEILGSILQQFEEIQSQISSVNEGCQRIKTIVVDLRTFSHLDGAERKTVTIVHSLESTLRLIQTQYKKTVEFVCDFQENPPLDCWPSQLNQVFMNLMVNACQAIEQQQQDSGISDKGVLTLRTSISEDFLAVQFKDTGCGMTEEVKAKMFEPFFTTKMVGVGTGMGMAISYGIVESHHGLIEVESAPGLGTCLTLKLPLEVPK